MGRILAWVVLILVVVGGTVLARRTGNPWGHQALTHATREEALHVPGCSDHPKDCGK